MPRLNKVSVLQGHINTDKEEDTLQLTYLPFILERLMGNLIIMGILSSFVVKGGSFAVNL